MENSLYVKYFEDMIIKIEKRKITLNEFINYCLRLEKAVKQSYIENPLKYAVKLLEARVEPKTNNNIKLYNSFKLYLINLSITIARKPEYCKILDSEYENVFNEMENMILLGSISYEKFVEFYKIVKLAINFPTKSINLPKIIQLLINSNVNAASTDKYNQIKKIKKDLTTKYKELKSVDINKQKRHNIY